MSDKIEKFIREHKDAFDVHTPRPELWDKIDDNLQHNKVHHRWRITAIAASVFLVVFVAAWLVMFFDKRPQLQPAYVATPANAEASTAELYYTSIVNEKQQELKRYATQYPKLYQQFGQDIIRLQAMYGQLKDEYAKTPEKDIVLQAMVENLQMQIRIIEQQLDILKQIPGNTAADSTHTSII